MRTRFAMSVVTLIGRMTLAAAAAAWVPLLGLMLSTASLVALARRWAHVGHSDRDSLEQPLASPRASIVILNWNGRRLLEQGLPSVLAAVSRSTYGDHEVIVVDNGSTDDSRAFVRQHFPPVRIVELPENRYFSAGNNAGAWSSTNDILVFLNNDMMVDPEFLDPLIGPLLDGKIFATASQILFLDPLRRREETGRTRGEFVRGAFRLSHEPVDNPVDNVIGSSLAPVLWASGGAAAYNRRKFMALGGFDELYTPAYVEDLALSFAAWRHGWSSVFVPQSKVFHEHRATSRRAFGDAHVDRLISRNLMLFAWRQLGIASVARHLGWLPVTAVRFQSRHGFRGGWWVLWSALTRLASLLVARARDTSPRVLDDRAIFGQGWGPESCEPFYPDPDPDNRSAINVRVASGWHAVERQPAMCRWTTGRARGFVWLSTTPARVHLRGSVPEFLVSGGRPVQVTLSVAGAETQELRFRQAGQFETSLSIPNGTFGWRSLSVDVDNAYCPAEQGVSSDARQLGVQIFNIDVEGHVGF